MGSFATARRAAVGRPTSQEFADASRGYSRRELRRVCRAALRGERLADPGDARLAVAIAREHLRDDHASRWLIPAFAVIVVLWLGSAIHHASAGKSGLAILFGVFTLAGVWCLVRMPQSRRGARRTLVLHPEIPEPPPRMASPGPGSWLLALALSFVWYTGAFGTLMALWDGDTPTPSRVLANGLAFGVLMTLFNQLVRERAPA